MLSLLGLAIGGVSSLIGASKAASAARATAAVGVQTSQANAELAGQVTGESLADYANSLAESLDSLQREKSESTRNYQTALDFQRPWFRAGKEAISGLSDAMNFRGQEGYDRAIESFQEGPGYQFAMDEGVKAREASAAGRGGVYSGAQGKALTEYGQGLANQEWSNHLSRLAGLSGVGQQASERMGDIKVHSGDARMQSAAAKADILLGHASGMGNVRSQGLSYATGANDQGGNARIAGIEGPANAWNTGLTNLSNLALYGINKKR